MGLPGTPAAIRAARRLEIAMELIVTAQTEVQGLVGGTFTTEHFGPFVLATVDHAPEMNAICYAGRDEQGYLFLAFLPYGAALIGE